MIKFVNQFDSGNSDCSKEKQEWIYGCDIETINKEVKKKNK